MNSRSGASKVSWPRQGSSPTRSPTPSTPCHRNGCLTIRIRGKNKVLEQRPVIRRHSPSPLLDTGSGIAQESLNKIFDPLLHPPKQDDGNGLGLWITHDIVTRHRGSIRVRSNTPVPTPAAPSSPRSSPTTPPNKSPGPHGKNNRNYFARGCVAS